jgi:hypothetical protein
MSSLANWVARHADLHDQSKDFRSTERRHVAATSLIWPGHEHRPKEVVARLVENAGSNLLVNVLQERMV